MNKRSGGKQISDKDAALELAGRIRSILNASMDVHRAPFNEFPPAPFNELFSASKSFQRRVLKLLRPPKLATGRPKKLITDEEWLWGVEWYRDLQRVGEQEAIRLWLTDTATRMSGRNGRAPGEKFRPDTPEGKKEVRRIQDACIRARRARRTKKAT